MPKAKKLPAVEATVSVIIREGDDDAIASLVEQVAALESSFSAVSIVIAQEVDPDEVVEPEGDEDETGDDDAADDEAGDEEDQPYSEDELEELGKDELLELMEEWELEAPRRFNKAKAIAAILEAQDEYYGSDDGDEDEGGAADEGDEDEDVLDEDDLQAMELPELKKVYKEVVGKTAPRGLKKDGLVEAILDAGEDEG